MFGQLIRLISLNIKFLFIEPRFRYCFFSHSITGLCFASCYRVRDKYASWDFHPRFMTCPSYQKKRAYRLSFRFVQNLYWLTFSIHQASLFKRCGFFWISTTSMSIPCFLAKLSTSFELVLRMTL